MEKTIEIKLDATKVELLLNDVLNKAIDKDLKTVNIAQFIIDYMSSEITTEKEHEETLKRIESLISSEQNDELLHILVTKVENYEKIYYPL